MTDENDTHNLDANNCDDSPWCALATKYRGNPNLEMNPLYSVPENLIVAVATEMPGLLTENEIEFEIDLRAATGGGFLNQIRFGYPPLGESACGEHPSQNDQQQRDTAAEIDQLLRKELVAEGFNNGEIDRAHREESELRQEIGECQAAYAGWLVSTAQFRRERDELRETWDEIVQHLGGFPPYARSFFGEAPFTEIPEIDNRQLHRYEIFLRRWGLDGFATWDLPLPMKPEFNQVTYDVAGQNGHTSYHNAVGLHGAGLLAFVPWCMLASDRLGLRSLARRAWRLSRHDHVRGWLYGNDNWGLDRYRRMLQIYRYKNLALEPRYGSRRQWKVTKLDLAFRCYFDTSVDTIKKVRLRLDRQLKDI